MITYLDRTSISLVGVRIKKEFGLTNEQFGWVLGAFALAYALFEIPSGMLGDRIGQKAVFIRIVLWWSLFTALTGAVTGLVSLVSVRFLFGMGESGAFPTKSGVISRWFPHTEASKSISVIVMGTSAGAAIAPILVIPVAVAFGWRSSFIVNGLLGVLWVLVCVRWFKNFPEEMKGISPEELTLIEKKRRYKNKLHRIDWKQVFKSRSIRALSIMFLCSQCGNYFFLAWMPIYLQEERHFSENSMKIITTFVFIPAIVSSLLAGYISDRLVKKRGLIFGRRSLGMFSLGMMGLLIFMTAITTNNAVAVAFLIMAYLFYLPTVIASVSTCVDIGGENAGTVTGIMNFFGQIGSFILAIIFGKGVDMSHSFVAPLYVLAAVLISGCLLWMAIDPTRTINIEKSAVAEIPVVNKVKPLGNIVQRQ